MARKKKAEEHENHERWLVSYADFITLLFAFFTSMYAISSVNEGKFRVLSESLAIAFNPSLYTTNKINEGPRFVRESRQHINDDFKEMIPNKYQKVMAALQELEKSKKLTLMIDEQRITIRIAESILFESGSGSIIESGKPVLDEIAAVIRDVPNEIAIEGHTDDVPTIASRYPTNWDLSSARSIDILKYFINEHKFEPRKLSAVGYGEFRPIDTNDTPAGRMKNRRVDILIIR